jgi:hypothetical protein
MGIDTSQWPGEPYFYTSQGSNTNSKIEAGHHPTPSANRQFYEAEQFPLCVRTSTGLLPANFPVNCWTFPEDEWFTIMFGFDLGHNNPESAIRDTWNGSDGTVFDNGTSYVNTTTSIHSDTITDPTANRWQGLTLKFTTGALAGRTTTITASSWDGTCTTLTVAALPSAPANDDQFVTDFARKYDRWGTGYTPTHADTAVDIWVANRGDTAWKKLISQTNFWWWYGDDIEGLDPSVLGTYWANDVLQNGVNVMQFTLFNGGSENRPVVYDQYQRIDQVIVSTQEIPLPVY